MVTSTARGQMKPRMSTHSVTTPIIPITTIAAQLSHKHTSNISIILQRDIQNYHARSRIALKKQTFYTQSVCVFLLVTFNLMNIKETSI